MKSRPGRGLTGLGAIGPGGRRSLFAVVLLVLALALVAARVLPARPFNQQVAFSRLVRAADGTVLRLTLASDGQYRLWTPLNRIAPPAVEAILLKEDRFFALHPGINPAALVRAAWLTYGRGERQGGSTLSMQLARCLYHLNTRRVPGKIRQILLSLWLEARYSKKDLLEAYCNLAPMGGNIEGVAAAARVYFGKEATDLTVAEGLALAVLPQSPAKRMNFGRDQQRARRLLAEEWHRRHPGEGPIAGLSDLDLAGSNRSGLPFLAPHFTDMQLQGPGQEQEIATTLDPKLQSLTERLLRQYIDEHRLQGLVNGTVLLVDRRDLGVKALVGSVNYGDKSIQGQVNGVLAKRSPGSTLKPFLYGLALDQGLIHPLSILRDAPTAFGSFQPENFDGRFVGPISARDALVRSRNVPAVGLANQLQHPSLYEFLRNAGISHLRPESHYGLSLVLGGGELTMEELAGLYVMLANDGLLKPLRYRRADAIVEGTRLLSPQSAFLVRDMLGANPRLDHQGSGHRTRSWRTAWKTGTSWGFRDAWTVGLVGEYVLAVWLGNFDGHPDPALVGVKAAAPLFFRIADALPLILADEADTMERIPPGLIQIEVCAASGELPNRWCPQTAKAWFIPGKSPIRVSTLHRPVMVDQRSGKAACPPFDPNTARQEIFEFWPSDMQRLFQEARLPRRLPPEPSPDCANPFASTVDGDAPRPSSPLADVVYTLRLSRPEERIDLQASIDASSERMYWFAKNSYLGECPRDGVLSWRPGTSGHYELTVVDDQGRSASRVLEVEFIP